MLTSANRFLKVLNGKLLTVKVVTLLVVKPPELLEHFGMVRVGIKNPHVGILSGIVLDDKCQI